jgi:hypothetical protein
VMLASALRMQAENTVGSLSASILHGKTSTWTCASWWQRLGWSWDGRMEQTGREGDARALLIRHCHSHFSANVSASADASTGNRMSSGRGWSALIRAL